MHHAWCLIPIIFALGNVRQELDKKKYKNFKAFTWKFNGCLKHTSLCKNMGANEDVRFQYSEYVPAYSLIILMILLTSGLPLQFTEPGRIVCL